MSSISFSLHERKNISIQIAGAVLFALILVILASFLWLVGFEVFYAGRIFPGVTVNGVDLAGLKPATAAARLSQSVLYPTEGKITLTDGSQSWSVTPAQLGFTLNPESSALDAYQVGREGNLFERINAQLVTWIQGADLSPVMVFDQRVGQNYLQNLAESVDIPVVEASLELNGTDVTVVSGQLGRQINIDKTLTLLLIQFQTMQDGTVNLMIQQTEPKIMDVTAQAEIARQILSEPLILSIPNTIEGDPGPWTFDVETLAPMLNIERIDDGASAKYQVVVNSEILREYLTNLKPDLKLAPVNTRFSFNDDTHLLEVMEPAVIGRELDVEASIQTVNEKLAQGEHNIPLVFSYTDPEVTDDKTGEQLGIVELVHEETSHFRGSSAARVQNITTASSRFNGLLVAPGETFSMGEALGDISLDNGYAEALIIYGDQTIKGVGGGVCQVSSTLFRTVFFAGFPIVERHAHAYRVSYYEQDASGVNPDYAGLDATVYFPLVDFKFTNDTPYWLLMETQVEGYSLTWKFYSTSDGRSVEWDTTGLKNITDPGDAEYRENDDLKKGEVKQVEWAVKGANVTVYRTVNRDGEVIISDQYATHYVPWPDAYEYGPGTPDMPPDKDDHDDDD